MALKLVDMLSVLVSFADDPKKMKEEVTVLGMRHVKVYVDVYTSFSVRQRRSIERECRFGMRQRQEM